MERARDQKEVQTTMNKYELALVVDAKIEEDVRVATVEKAKDYVTHAIEDALDIGKGYGPTNHFFAFHKA